MTDITDVPVCGRCRKPTMRVEFCWYCGDELCGDCWEEWGHCGHDEAEKINEACRTATPGQKAQMIKSVLDRQGGYVEMLVEPDKPN